jgi:uncharacterized membrane protein
MEQRKRKEIFEARWPVGIAIVSLLLLLTVLPDRIRLYPSWIGYVAGVAVLTPLAGVGLTAAKEWWRSIERIIILVFVVVAGGATLVNLANLTVEMLSSSAHASGMQLLTSSIALWVTNVFIFSLLYWQIDRGGPEGRIEGAGNRPDWLFPQAGAPAGDVPDDWHPTFVDYLYLSYSTATAFSTTEVSPLTPRAKLLMMLQSMISLITVVLVASRAINILGS